MRQLKYKSSRIALRLFSAWSCRLKSVATSLQFATIERRGRFDVSIGVARVKVEGREGRVRGFALFDRRRRGTKKKREG